MQAIKDAVHDYVDLCPLAADLLDTHPLQRLRHVRQLSTVALVYPSANHTRFEHSLGVYHLAREAAERLGLEGEDALRVRAAALLHDVGHGPFGHQTEPVIGRHLGRHHDEVGALLSGTDAADVLVDHGLSVPEIAETIAGEAEYGRLVSGDLDVDRMDYLVRDAHHTGVPYGTVDHGRLLRAFRYRDGRLVLAEGNVATAESVLVARTLMNATVYRHHVSRIAGAMLDRAAERLLDDGFDPERFARLTDHELLVAFGEREETADTARRLGERDLYKRAGWLTWEDVPRKLVDNSYLDVRTLERKVAGLASVDEREVILDNPGRPSIPESGVRVVVNGEVERLADASTLVGGLDACAREQWRLGVYAPDEHVGAVSEAAATVLDVE
ncbi:HD domain-containing protein [Natronorarus salvus]|uniref:HD domain-containing protein n=1 Tax=Natronorarus salvus TaxID=3117733 RepID=UPI002F260EC5